MRHTIAPIALFLCVWCAFQNTVLGDDEYRKKICGDIAVVHHSLSRKVTEKGGDELGPSAIIAEYAGPLADEQTKKMCQSVNKRKSLSELERTQKDNDLREKLLSFAINMPDEDNLKSLQVLLKDGANPVITNEKGTRMLQGFLRTLSDDVRVATCLLQYTARGQLKGDIDGGLFRRLIEAIQKKKRDDLDKLVKLLIDAMWSEELRIKTDTEGWTAVMWAARKGRPNIARALIGSAEYYAPEKVDYVGSALHMAAKQGSTDTIEILLAHPNVNVDTRSKVNNLTPLHFACLEDHLEVVKQLLNRGADPCSKDWENHMPVDKVITGAKNAGAIKKALKDAAKRKYETTCDQLPTEPVRRSGFI